MSNDREESQRGGCLQAGRPALTLTRAPGDRCRDLARSRGRPRDGWEGMAGAAPPVGYLDSESLME